MNLWIRSQDKMILEKVERVKILGRNEKDYVYYDIHCKFENTTNFAYERMGAYKTKERALEVLDEIQALLINQCVPPELKLYQMPKELI